MCPRCRRSQRRKDMLRFQTRDNMPVPAQYRGRAEHSLVLYRGSAFVFGGRSEHGALADFWEHNISGGFWVDHTRTVHPDLKPRYAHQAVLLGSHMVLFGGTDGKRYFTDVWECDLSNMVWCRTGAPSAEIASERASALTRCRSDASENSSVGAKIAAGSGRAESSLSTDLGSAAGVGPSAGAVSVRECSVSSDGRSGSPRYPRAAAAPSCAGASARGGGGGGGGGIGRSYGRPNGAACALRLDSADASARSSGNVLSTMSQLDSDDRRDDGDAGSSEP
eukprot:6191187-Pleurochrysis_carterae.AAC.2